MTKSDPFQVYGPGNSSDGGYMRWNRKLDAIRNLKEEVKEITKCINGKKGCKFLGFSKKHLIEMRNNYKESIKKLELEMEKK